MKNRTFLLSVALVAVLSFALNQQSNPIVTWFSSASTAEAQATSRTFAGEGGEAARFFFIEMGIKPFQDGVAIDDTPLTTQKICELAGYSRVAYLTTRKYRSCGDNFVETWNGSSWVRSGACATQPYIDTLTCDMPIVVTTQCSDGLDNDGDGAADMNDFSCTSTTDNDETNTKSACQDGADNDADGKTDYPLDPGCTSLQDNDEYNVPAAQCQDSIDNDGDTLADGNDPGCHVDFNRFNSASYNANGTNEASNNLGTCANGRDDDSDNLIDAQDPSCHTDNNPNNNGSFDPSKNETNAPSAVQCNDNVDNDNDGLADINDPGCHTDFNRFNAASYNAQGTNEASNNLGTCANGRDDDSDNLIDAQDPSCHTDGIASNNASFDPSKNESNFSSSSSSSSSSLNNGPSCNDNVDNDNDGQIDINDPGCHTDKNRYNPLSYNPNGNEFDNNRAYTCQDGVDNNTNGLVDAQDPICHTDGNAYNPGSFNPNGNEGYGSSSSSSSSSSNGIAQCSNGYDDDADSLVDGNDPGCHTDKNRYNPASYNPNGTENGNDRSRGCQDGIDNNGNGLIDAQDAACHTDGNPNNTGSFDPTRNEDGGNNNQGNGCINVRVRAEDEDGDRITKDLDGFIITVDGSVRTNETDDDGEVQFKNLSNGSHYVNIQLDSDWELDNVSPTNGNVTTSGSSCKTVTFNIVEDDNNNDDDDDNDADIDVRKTASAGEVFPGGTIEYTITIENTGDVDLTDLVVEDRIPSDLIILDDGDADEKHGNTLTWNIDVDEGDTETIRYRVSVPSYTYPGQSIRNDVNVTSDDNDIDIDEDASAFVTIIGTLPQTGVMGSLTNSSMYLSPMSSSTTGGTNGGGSAAALIVTVLTGIGGGVSLGRKYLMGL